MDVVKASFSLLLCMLLLSMPLVAEEAAELDETVDAEAGTYLIDESESEVILDGELTPEGQRAMEQARQNGELPYAELPSPNTNAADAKLMDEMPELAARGLDEEVQSLKEEVLILNRELFSLEEELLFPSNTQFAVYVSVDVGEFFDMESVRVLLDNKPIASYLYTKRESDALMRGGVHRIYIGNITAGSHELVAFYTGRGPRGRDFKRATKRTVNKELGPKYVELKIADNQGKKQSGFEVKEW